MPSSDFYLSYGPGPLWILHLPTFTLARLDLHPPGPHRLVVRRDGPLPEDVHLGIVALLEEIAPGSTEGLIAIARPDANLNIYESKQVLMAPASIEPGFVAVNTQPPALAIGYHPQSGQIIGPLWETPPAHSELRRTLIESLTSFALANLSTEQALPTEPPLSAADWLETPDTTGSGMLVNPEKPTPDQCAVGDFFVAIRPSSNWPDNKERVNFWPGATAPTDPDHALSVWTFQKDFSSSGATIWRRIR